MRILKMTLLGVLFLGSSATIHAAEIEAQGTPLRKLQRGFLNIALSPIEVSHELHVEKKKEKFPASWVYGLGRGIGYAAVRAGTGAYEMLTFFIPSEPVLEPEFAWEYLEAKN